MDCYFVTGLCLILQSFYILGVISNGGSSDTATSPSFTMQRIRNERLSLLRQYVLQSLGLRMPPAVSRFRTAALQREFQNCTVLRKACYLPTCMLPNRINNTLFLDNRPRQLKLYFDTIPLNNGEATILNATLKLKVKGYAGNESGGRRVPGPTVTTRAPTFDVDVYQYTRPLRLSRRDRRRIVNSKVNITSETITMKQNSSWVSFDVTTAATEWAKNPRKNNGLLIQIKDPPVPGISNIFNAIHCDGPLDTDCTEEELSFWSANAVLEIRKKVQVLRQKRDTIYCITG